MAKNKKSVTTVENLWYYLWNIATFGMFYLWKIVFKKAIEESNE